MIDTNKLKEIAIRHAPEIFDPYKVVTMVAACTSICSKDEYRERIESVLNKSEEAQ